MTAGGFSSPPLLLASLACKWPNLEARCPGPVVVGSMYTGWQVPSGGRITNFSPAKSASDP